tara:strand:+ start:303 stop:635 length:333 start_codon:yes stop_codon:yes gene_type:complete
MKTLKFRPHLCDQIIAGEKTCTWRLFDDKDLQPGERVEFQNWETKEPIGEAVLHTIVTKTLGTLTESDWEGHEKFESDEEMYATYRTYYGDQVGPDTELKIIDFEFTPKT